MITLFIVHFFLYFGQIQFKDMDEVHQKEVKSNQKSFFFFWPSIITNHKKIRLWTKKKNVPLKSTVQRHITSYQLSIKQKDENYYGTLMDISEP